MGKKILDWIQKQISIGNIAVIIFLIGGFYYTTQFKLSTLEDDMIKTDERFDQHIEYQFRPLRETVRDNQKTIQEVQGNYQTLEKLIKQQQLNNEQQFKRIESRLDYIIKRIDSQ